jgi:nitrous oxidase accessory protein
MRKRAVFLTLLLASASSQPVTGAETTVRAEPGALVAALKAAAPGDTIRLGMGDHAGPVDIDKPLTILGDGKALILGNGEGSVITIKAAGVTIEGVSVEGSGGKLDQLDAGIKVIVGADKARLIGNRLTGNLIGIDMQGGKDALVENNTIANRTDLHRAERGPGIYVWNSPGLTVAGNEISGGNDGIFITTSHHATYRDNRMHDVRFAIHSMYANDIKVFGNRSTGNDMGYAFMYSRQVQAANNLSDGDRTHGIFLNYVTDAKLAHNDIRNGGEKCLFVYNVNKAAISANRFEGCDIGVHFTGGSENVTMTGNAFLHDRTEVKYVGSRWLEWSLKGRGNYWAGHVAFDVNRDGIADSPYRPNDSIDRMTWSQPTSRLLLGSPAVQMIRWAQSRFPGLLPGGVIDSHPLMSPDGSGLDTPELATKGGTQ